MCEYLLFSFLFECFTSPFQFYSIQLLGFLRLPTVRNTHWYSMLEMGMVNICLMDPIIPVQCPLMLVEMFRFTPHYHLSFSGHQFFPLIIVKHHQLLLHRECPIPAQRTTTQFEKGEMLHSVVLMALVGFLGGKADGHGPTDQIIERSNSIQ